MFPTLFVPSSVDVINPSQVKLLLHGEGTDGATVFTDSSIYARTPVVYGNAQIDVGESKFGSSSIFLDGTGDYLEYGPSTDFDLTANDNWTVEVFARWASVQNRDHVWEFGVDADNRCMVFVDTAGDKNLIFYKIYNQTFPGLSLGVTGPLISPSVWYHICMMRKGSLIHCFVDGVNYGTLDAEPMFSGSVELFLGHQPYAPNFAADYFYGWLDEFRYITGAAVYPITGFTPPTAPHPDP